LLTIDDMDMGVELDAPHITLRAGVMWRYRIPNYVVLSHVYGQKPRLKWIAPLKVACPECGSEFKNEAGARSHFARMHPASPWPWKLKWKPEQPAKPKARKPQRIEYPRWPA
jgi:hypothetical protein